MLSTCAYLFSLCLTMSDLRTLSKACLTDFIELYKSYPCLWKIKSGYYKDRNKKDAAYEALMKKLKEVEPEATKTTVKAKINSLRCSFRREMKKIKDSKRSGADDVYKTRLWYYDLLLFIKDQKMPQESVCCWVENQEGGSEQEPESEGKITQKMEPVDDNFESLINSPHSSVTSDCSQNISDSITPSAASSTIAKKRKTKCDEQADEVLTMVAKRLHNNTTNKDDAFDIIGKNVAAKLRTLPKITKL